MMVDSPHPVFVIVLNWNLAQETILCARSLQQDQLLNVKLIIVDNGSTDNSVDMIRDALGDAALIIENGENLGFAGGNNVGIQRALHEGAESILLLNNDTLVAPDMLYHLVSVAERSPRVGIVGPAIFYHDHPDLIWGIGAQQRRWLPLPVTLSQSAWLKLGTEPFRLDYVTACGMLIRRQVFETIGLLDSRYFIYFEDGDFCRRAHRAGYEIWCAPRAHMWHKVSLTMSKQKPAMRYAEWWGRARFYASHPQLASRAAISAYLIAKAVRRTILDVFSRDWGLIKPLWVGAFDGIWSRPSRHFDFFA